MATPSMRRFLYQNLRKLGYQDGGRLFGSEFMKATFATSGWQFSKKINSFDFMDNRLSLGLNDKTFGTFDKVAPQTVSEKLAVPDLINRPDYLSRSDGNPPRRISRNPVIKTKDDLVFMREACQIARRVMDLTLEEVKVGITTDELDKFAHYLITKSNAYPSALGYKNFPKSICTSVNNVACHGIPDDRKIAKGDIITVDVMAYKNGFHGDCAGTTVAGLVDDVGLKLIDAAEACLIAGVQECGPNKPFANIGKAIEACAKSHKVTVLHAFTGHGVGRNVHEKPDVYHYFREEDEKMLMKPGMVFTIEPIVAQGMDLVMVLSDGWTAATVDGGRAAQFEHTIHITDNGIEILTDDPGPTHYVENEKQTKK